MFGGIIKAVSGAFQAFNAWMRRNELVEARKDGARQTDLAGRNKQDEVRKSSKKVRRRPPVKLKRDAVNRLRRNKSKSRD